MNRKYNNMTEMLVKSVLFCVLFEVFSCNAQKYIGDLCTHSRTNRNGMCKSIGSCPAAIQELQRGIMPQTCGFDVTAPIVCCPSEEQDVLVEKMPVIKAGAKSIQKCKEYASYVNVTYIPPTLSGGSKKKKTRSDCGFKPIKLVVGGKKAGAKEFPHMALIGYENGNSKLYGCGGSLISENFILTAGHCLISRDYGEAKYVRVGDLNIADDYDDSDPQELNVIQIIKHPEYIAPSKYNDIGLLKLDSNVVFTPYVRPVCLNVNEDFDAMQAIATGWGDTEYMGTASKDLMKVTLELYSHDECSTSFAPNRRQLANGIVDTTQVCAGSKVERKDTCQGDSGGPLQIYHLEVYCMYIQVGVTSFGKACGVSAAPGVYTRVSHYIDWIEKNVWA